MSKVIPLKTKGKLAIVDDEDYELLAQTKWYPNGENEKSYALGSFKVGNKRVYRLMHRVIWEHYNGPIPKNKELDHKNLNPLDNRKENLRLCTHSENMQNVRSHKGSRSKFKGVWPYKGRWASAIQCNCIAESLGYFDTEEEAAHAYDRRARELAGNFARLNFPEGPQ